MTDTRVTGLRHGRLLAGALVKDLPRYLSLFARGGEAYLAIRNRGESLEPAPQGSGFRCNWQWTSKLHAPTVIPYLGRSLMRRCLAPHPIVRRAAPPPSAKQTPDISFLIGHRGEARLPHLLATLESIAGQAGAAIECLVVEQDLEARLSGRLPVWVRHVHTPPPAGMPYCRAWVFNVGAGLARGRTLVLHDNDMLVPRDYARHILDLAEQGWEAINPKRFIFYLSEAHTQKVFAGHERLSDCAPASIIQNLEAGGSVAISHEAYQRIGGMDEGFIGWGGEDNEFWERCQTLKVWPYGALPLVHFWHPSQPGKYQADNQTLKRYRDLSSIPPQRRIEHLRQMPAGQPTGPTGWSTTGLEPSP